MFCVLVGYWTRTTGRWLVSISLASCLVTKHVGYEVRATRRSQLFISQRSAALRKVVRRCHVTRASALRLRMLSLLSCSHSCKLWFLLLTFLTRALFHFRGHSTPRPYGCKFYYALILFRTRFYWDGLLASVLCDTFVILVSFLLVSQIGKAGNR